MLRVRRPGGRAEKSATKQVTDRAWKEHSARFDQLRAQQTAERQAQRDQHYASTRGITFAHAKASLVNEQQGLPANANEPRAQSRATDIKKQMEDWRRQNPGRDFGLEM